MVSHRASPSIGPRARGSLGPDYKQSSTCLPLPTDPLSRAFPLLSPIRYKSICALGSERFELRTLGLGCQVSTITFLTSVITIFSTLVGVLVLWSLFTCTKGVHRGLRALKGGYMVYPTDEQFKGQVWARKGDSWLRPWKVLGGKQRIFRLEETDTGSRNEIRTWRGRQQSRNIVIQGMEVSPLLPDQRGYGA
jgi:hypothetical protein